jgi:hypothetical protein
MLAHILYTFFKFMLILLLDPIRCFQGHGGIVVHEIHVGDQRNAYTILVRNVKGRSNLGKTRHRWEGNIKMNFK